MSIEMWDDAIDDLDISGQVVMAKMLASDLTAHAKAMLRLLEKIQAAKDAGVLTQAEALRVEESSRWLAEHRELFSRLANIGASSPPG